MSIHVTADNQSAISNKFIGSLNSPWPWVCLFAAVLLYVSLQASQAKDSAEVSRQTAWKAETESMMLREHVDQLRIELATHGLKPLPLPKCLVENTPCQTRQLSDDLTI